MDTRELAMLGADIAAQRVTIDRVFAMLLQRSQNISPENLEKMESSAYQLHNFYGAVEELLKIVANYFENNVSDAAQWHSLLLKRMMQPVQGVRPALLSTETYDLLNALRAFRHFFRHAYGIPLDFWQLTSNLNKAVEVKPLLDRDFGEFLQIISDRNINGEQSYWL
ncbi:hypothetical protein NWP17_09865 [Chrysosporum bergii ANA360D]|jgi:hypothetical protein|uniref:HepT-like domain-containing protein n=1 Tax=Chrysosporum bergii ANA360D TaxID=617107 RepID=A0AA43GSA0_9CYAN|nr:hypothetical protein [Chrysosporum bergii]MDH6060744.1 hypothetical protein [Chrysosporum bergii ANA360D]